MGLMKMKESKFGAPAGIYTGKYLGVAAFKGDGKPRYGNDGNPMEPGIEWQFEITEGEQFVPEARGSGGARVQQVEVRRSRGLESPTEGALVELPRALHIGGKDLEVND